MLLSTANDVRVYNLSVGKSLPEWLSDRTKRKLQKKDIDVRRRVELIQDFDMPDFSNCVRVTPDGQYIFAAGMYKPRIKCYDVHNLSMKFERCLDAEVIKMDILSDGYEKLVFLEEERYVEFHVQYGRYYKMRIPKFGRDMAYHKPSCDLYIAASGPDIYRINLEQGRFMTPIRSEGTSLLCCTVNPEHHLFMCGTWEGCVEAYDPRDRKRVGVLDCALQSLIGRYERRLGTMPSVSALKFKNSMTLAVGTSSGQVLMYDIRSNKSLLVKDHQTDSPIRAIAFSAPPAAAASTTTDEDVVLSMDERMVKLWRAHDGSPYTAIEPGHGLNDMCLVEGTGLLMLANESPKLFTYYIPSLGPAPKWCSFLDSITEELDTTEAPAVYDDYKFVTADELESLGVSNLIGTNLVRAYMHGYFLHAQLYRKAVDVVRPFAWNDYKKSRVRRAIDEERDTANAAAERTTAALPTVNRQLALRLREQQLDDTGEGGGGKKKKKNKNASAAAAALQDDRFKALFEDAQFEIDEESEQFQLLRPVLNKHADKQRKRQATADDDDRLNMEVDEVEGRASSDESENDDNEASSSSSSDDDRQTINELKQTHKRIMQNRKENSRTAEYRTAPQQPSTSATPDAADDSVVSKRSYTLRSGDEFTEWTDELSKGRRATADEPQLFAAGGLSVADRLRMDGGGGGDDDGAEETLVDRDGVKEMVFRLQKKTRAELSRDRKSDHVRERRLERRSAADVNRKLPKPAFLLKKKKK